MYQNISVNFRTLIPFNSYAALFLHFISIICLTTDWSINLNLQIVTLSEWYANQNGLLNWKLSCKWIWHSKRLFKYFYSLFLSFKSLWNKCNRKYFPLYFLWSCDISLNQENTLRYFFSALICNVKRDVILFCDMLSGIFFYFNV